MSTHSGVCIGAGKMLFFRITQEKPVRLVVQIYIFFRLAIMATDKARLIDYLTVSLEEKK